MVVFDQGCRMSSQLNSALEKGIAAILVDVANLVDGAISTV